MRGNHVSELEHFVNVADSKRECDYHDEASGPVEDQRPDHAQGQSSGCISDFLSCVTALT